MKLRNKRENSSDATEADFEGRAAAAGAGAGWAAAGAGAEIGPGGSGAEERESIGRTCRKDNETEH